MDRRGAERRAGKRVRRTAGADGAPDGGERRGKEEALANGAVAHEGIVRLRAPGRYR